MNEIYLLIIELILCFSILLLLYKIYHKTGIYAYCIISMILTSIMSLKTITLYDYDMNLGIIPFVTLFTASNILIQKNGTEEPKTLLLVTTISSLIGYIILLLISYITPSSINLFMSASYDNIFNGSIRLLIAYIFSKDLIDIIKIIMIRYLISLCVGILSTIVIYITKFFKMNE